ncbi:MAG: thioredoxin domain-containing protein [Candidatus Binatia bacterium]
MPEAGIVAQHTNRLIHETSPYLRQHAHNPVDWYPWGAEALARARAENKPILLSIGYSACHWCHVMAHESFADEETARLMNERFVNVKVDREERPDIDHLYMNAVQMLAGRGGWPMTMFLTPDAKPFYGGTYFPPEDRYGVPSFRRVLLAVAEAYREKPEDVRKTVGQVLAGLQRMEAVEPSRQPVDAGLTSSAAARLSEAYDAAYGGLGGAPKFPNAAVLDLFLRTYRHSGQQRYLQMVLHTLRQMARGGIYDQLGGGFHRYSVDERWLVPHFEKMLYDNAQLVPLYLSAYQLTGEPFFAEIARDVLAYVSREMRSAEGGFYATQDADSEGEEGRFFLWDVAEVRACLGDEAADLVCRYWDVSEAGNFEHRNILHVTLEVEQLARMFRRDAGEVRRLIAEARSKLFAARALRVKAGLDDKILTSWNGLMISAYAKAAEVLADAEYRQTAIEAVAFVKRQLQRGTRLLSSYKGGVARLNGYLDDYAFFVQALLDVFELVQERQYLEDAIALADVMITHFWDARSAGFFFTSDDHEALIMRSKPATDGSVPSGNSVAVAALLRLYYYTENAVYLDRAAATLHLFSAQMREQPFGFARMLCAADFYTRKPYEIVAVAAPSAAGAVSLLRGIRQAYVPNRILRVVDPTRGGQLPAQLHGKGQVNGKPTVYVCHDKTCSAPATTWEELQPLLQDMGGVQAGAHCAGE